MRAEAGRSSRATKEALRRRKLINRTSTKEGVTVERTTTIWGASVGRLSVLVFKSPLTRVQTLWICQTVDPRRPDGTSSRMEASADWPSLQKRGFLVIKQFLSAEQCAELAETYQTLPAATDSVGFGVRWASKHVA